jgi:hypothetical protein
VCCQCGPLGSWLTECKRRERRRRAASCPRPACLWTAVRYVRCTNTSFDQLQSCTVAEFFEVNIYTCTLDVQLHSCRVYMSSLMLTSFDQLQSCTVAEFFEVNIYTCTLDVQLHSCRVYMSSLMLTSFDQFQSFRVAQLQSFSVVTFMYSRFSVTQLQSLYE